MLTATRAIILIGFWLLIMTALTGCSTIADWLTTSCAEADTLVHKYCKEKP